MVSVGSVSVDVVPNAKGWVSKLRAQIIPDADALGIEIGRTLSARINEALGNAHLTVDVDSAVADAQLLATESIVDRLDGRKINLNVGAGGANPGAFAGIATALGDSVSSMSALIPLVAVLGTALIPVVASATGLAAALVLPLAAAGGGLGLGAVLAGFAIKNVEKTSKKIDQLRQRAAALHGQAKKDALDQADSLEKSLSGPQKAFLNAQGKLGAAFAKLQTGKVGDALFAPLVSGMNLLSKILPALAPVIESVSHALTGLLDSLSKSASGKGFTNFVDGFAKLAGATITSGAKSAATFLQGLFNIFTDFLPLSSSVGTGLQGLADKFLAFSQKTSTKQGIQSFIEYVKANGPAVLSAIGNIVVAFVRLGVALAPIGAKVLAVMTAIAKGFNKIPTGLATSVLSPILGIARVFRSIYNSTLGPVFAAIIHSIALVMNAAGHMLSILGKAPGFGWAKKLGADLQNAAHQANSVADAIRKIPTSHKTTITVTTVHKGGKVITGGGRTGNLTAVGGVFNGAQQRIIGEAGPEAVVPLNRPLSQVDPAVRQLSAFAQGMRMPAASSSSSSGGSAQPLVLDGLVVGYVRSVANQVVIESQDYAGTVGRMSR